MLLSIVSVTSLSGCITMPKGSLKVYDRPICGDLGEAGAYCKHLYTPGAKDVAKADWDKERIGWICTDGKGENDIEVEIDQACTMLNCTYEQREELRLAKIRLRTVMAKAAEAKKKTFEQEPAQ